MILTEDEIIVINSKNTCFNSGSEVVIYARIYDLHQKSSENYFQTKVSRFLCNSTKYKNDNFLMLKNI